MCKRFDADFARGWSLGPAELRAELGRGTWNLLHRMAGQFPKEPTEADKAEYSAFFASFARLYPCKVRCAACRRSPPRFRP